jgi:hypothetical protein
VHALVTFVTIIVVIPSEVQRFVLLQSYFTPNVQNYISRKPQLPRFRNSALKIDPQFGFLGGGRMWVWTTTVSFQILAGP